MGFLGVWGGVWVCLFGGFFVVVVILFYFLFLMMHLSNFFLFHVSLPSCFGKYCIALAFPCLSHHTNRNVFSSFSVTFSPVSAILFNKKYPNTPSAVILLVAFGAHRKVDKS